MVVRQLARMRMKHRATVQRATSAVDDFGHDTPASWATLHAQLPCTYWEDKGMESVDGDIQFVRDMHRLNVPRSTDVTELDRVTAVTDRTGNTIVSGTLEVRHITRRPTHLALELRRVSG